MKKLIVFIFVALFTVTGCNNTTVPPGMHAVQEVAGVEVHYRGGMLDGGWIINTNEHSVQIKRVHQHLGAEQTVSVDNLEPGKRIDYETIHPQQVYYVYTTEGILLGLIKNLVDEEAKEKIQYRPNE